MATSDQHITVLVGPTCPACESDDLRWGAPLGAPWPGQCRDCGTEYLCYEAPAEDNADPSCHCCGSPLPDGQDAEDDRFCEDCELSDCAYCGATAHRFELSENRACRVCETGEAAA